MGNPTPGIEQTSIGGRKFWLSSHNLCSIGVLITAYHQVASPK